MSDPIAGSALVIAILAGLNGIINTLHIRKCKALGCQSECSSRGTPPTSPMPSLVIEQSNKKKPASIKDETNNKDNSINV